MAKQSRTELMAYGAEIGRLRVSRGWAQSRLLKELDRVLARVGYEGKLLSEKWLGRLENGRSVILPRQIFNALGEALSCTDEELARLHLLADRNVVVIIPGVTTKLKERFNYLVFKFLDDMSTIIDSQTASQINVQLSEEDMDELIYSAVELIIAERRSRKK